MTLAGLLKERGLEVDDVRWYLSVLLAQRLLQHRESPSELVRLVWSGRLEAELYHMEERFLEELERKVSSGVADEHRVREIMSEIETQKRSRHSGRSLGDG
jgi:hypothetical protein